MHPLPPTDVQILTRCRTLYQTLDDFLDGRLTHGARLRVRAHLLFCRKCRVYLREYRSVRALTGRAAREDPPEDFERMMQRVLRRWKDGRGS